MAETKKKITAKKKKPEAKSSPKSEVKTTVDSAADAKAAKSPGDAAESGSAGYTIGENQKAVTESYRKGWDSIFSKKD